MAETPQSKLPGLIGVVLAILLLGGLAATPFYLPALRHPPRQLDSLVNDEVETIRRATLHLDADLACLQALYEAFGEDALDSSSVEALLEQNADLFDQDTLSGFNRTLQTLRSLDDKDQSRGTGMASAGPPLPSQKPNLRTAFADMRSKVLKAQSDALAAAESSVKKLQTLSVGDVRAKNHLAANRVAAMLYFGKGQIARHRALIAQNLGLERLVEAEALGTQAHEIRRVAAAVLAQRPEAALQKAEQDLRQLTQAIEQLQAHIAATSSAIASTEQRIAELETQARQARSELATLESSGAPIHEPDSRYLTLSDAARQAEAQAHALANGTLANATVVRLDSAEFGLVEYQGGERQPGLVDQQRQLELMHRQLALLEQMKAAAEKERATHAEDIRLLTEQAGQIEGEAAGQTTKARQRVQSADEDFTRAADAADDAIKAFVEAEKSAKQASVDANRRSSAADIEMKEAKPPEADRLQMILDDKDIEAALRGLAAESAYQHALVLAEQMLALHASHEAQQRIAAALGTKPPGDVASQIEELRDRAKEQLDAAQISFGYAERLTSTSRARTSQGLIQGKNYVWQVKLGQAAVELLQAALAFDDPGIEQTEKDAAYQLLTEALQGREQSPLLSPAFAALRQLHKNPG